MTFFEHALAEIVISKNINPYSATDEQKKTIVRDYFSSVAFFINTAKVPATAEHMATEALKMYNLTDYVTGKEVKEIVHPSKKLKSWHSYPVPEPNDEYTIPRSKIIEFIRQYIVENYSPKEQCRNQAFFDGMRFAAQKIATSFHRKKK